MANKLTQCEINTAETLFTKAVEEFESANQKMEKAVEKLIFMLAKLDEDLLSPKRHITIHQIDGEYLTNYHTRRIEIEEDDTIVIVCEDDYEEETTFDLYDLSTEEIRCLGSILYDNYQQKYGKQKTYKDMAETESKEEVVYICPSCGMEFSQGDYNYDYDSGLLDFECDTCGWCGTDKEVKVKEE